MKFRLKASHLIALAIAVGIGAWMSTGRIEIGGQGSSGAAAPPIAERGAERANEAFKVRFVTLMPETRQEELEVRGRTRM